MARPSKKILLKVIEKSCGVVTYAGKMCKVDRRTFHRWMVASPWIKEAMEEARDNLVDLAEETLIKAIKKKDVKASIYVTSTLGKRRGYTQLTEIRDRSKLKDAMEDLTDEELVELLDRNDRRIKDC